MQDKEAHAVRKIFIYSKIGMMNRFTKVILSDILKQFALI